MASVRWQSIVRQACGDTLAVLRRHWVIEFIAAAALLLATVGVFGVEGNWREAVIPVIAELGAMLAIILAIFVHYAVKAPKRIRDTVAAEEFAGMMEQSNQDVMFTYLRNMLRDEAAGVVDACVFGSAVFAYPPPHDVDLAVRFADLPDPKIVRANDRLARLALEFKEQFQCPLHVEKFLYREVEVIEKFSLHADPKRNILGDIWR